RLGAFCRNGFFEKPKGKKPNGAPNNGRVEGLLFSARADKKHATRVIQTGAAHHRGRTYSNDPKDLESNQRKSGIPPIGGGRSERLQFRSRTREKALAY